MSFFGRISNGWAISKTSLKTIRENPSLMIFPLIAGTSLILVALSFVGGTYLFYAEGLAAPSGEDLAGKDIVFMMAGFLFYFINYFIIIFFNVGLVHCAKQILEGEQTSVSQGIRYAFSRLGVILAWASLAATVGLILKTIQERAGAVGKIITGIIGVIWGIATYFVIPVIAYENVGPFQAIKRSSEIIKNKWGESLGANFSFGAFTVLGLLLIALPIGFLIGYAIHPVAGFLAGLLIYLAIQTVMSAANVVFLAAAYQHVNEAPVGHFSSDLLDDMFFVK